MSKEFEKQFLIGEKVYLRPFEREDIRGPYRQWINDFEITRYLTAGAFPYSDEELDAYFDDNLKDRNAVFFAIVEKNSHKIVGTTRIHSINWIHRNALRGIMIDKQYWGKGYGSEAICLISVYAFEKLNLNKLKSHAFDDNIGVHKVNEKAGYKKEGTAIEEIFRDGQYHKIIYYGLLKSDFMKKQKKK